MSREAGSSQPTSGMATGQVGMLIVFASLAMVFGATIIAYWIARLNARDWGTAELSTKPWGLFASTLCIGFGSWALQRGLAGIRRNNQTQLLRGLSLGAAAAGAFLLCQVLNWAAMLGTTTDADAKNLYLFTFYMLTGVHALHVLAGFVPLFLVTFRARRREYSSSRYEGVTYCVQYWHFIGAVWLLLLLVIFLAV